VIPTTNGEEAYHTALKEIPDLILLDVRMPRMTGYEACKKLKASENTKDIPVVFLSAKGQESEVNEGFEAGAVEYILKPFSPDQLSQQIQSILDKNFK
jgi:CheY-like chemotaxis protein